MQSAINNPEKLAVMAIDRDVAKIWRHGIAPQDLPELVHAPVEVDHRHMRTGQFHHGHDTSHLYPEFFEEIYQMIREFDVLLLIGHGEGKASALSNFLDYLNRKHPDVYRKVIDSLNLNLVALTDHQITMHARQWFEKNYRKLATWHDRQPNKWIT